MNVFIGVSQIMLREIPCDLLREQIQLFCCAKGECLQLGKLTGAGTRRELSATFRSSIHPPHQSEHTSIPRIYAYPETMCIPHLNALSGKLSIVSSRIFELGTMANTAGLVRRTGSRPCGLVASSRHGQIQNPPGRPA
jgi:hypothetical protein